MRNKIKAFQLTIKAFQQPTLSDACIYFENAYNRLKIGSKPKKAYAIGKDQQVQRVLIEKPLNLQHLTPSYLAEKKLLETTLQTKEHLNQ